MVNNNQDKTFVHFIFIKYYIKQKKYEKSLHLIQKELLNQAEHDFILYYQKSLVKFLLNKSSDSIKINKKLITIELQQQENQLTTTIESDIKQKTEEKVAAAKPYFQPLLKAYINICIINFIDNYDDEVLHIKNIKRLYKYIEKLAQINRINDDYISFIYFYTSICIMSYFNSIEILKSN